LIPSPASPAASGKSGIPVSLEDRWLILGTTGSGKTTFAKKLLQQHMGMYPDVPVYILDSKAVGDFTNWYKGLVTDSAPPGPIEKGVQVWQPGIDDLHAFDAWFAGIRYAPGPAMVLIDEVSSLVKRKGDDAPHYFQTLLKQGRALGKLVISCSQEMPYVPRQIKTQSTHAVRFRLVGSYDPREANKLMGRDALAPEPRAKYGFFYGRMDRLGKVLEYPSYTDFF